MSKKKGFILVVGILLMFCFSGSSIMGKEITQSSVTYQEVFPDAKFADVVAKKVGYSKKITDVVTQVDLDKITGTLFASSKEITSLEGIGYLRNLRILYADNNQISEIPAEISDLTSLEILDLGKNNVSVVPTTALSQMTQLKSITLSNNAVSEIPSDIDAVASASKLDFQNNSITQLPESIGNLVRITSLNFSHNQLTELPESIGNYTAISSLDLQHNNLGSIPDSLGNLTSLSTLYLNNNKLTALPTTLENISPSYFYLNNNALVGRLPNITGYGYQNYGQTGVMEKKEYYKNTPFTGLDLLPEILTQAMENSQNSLATVGSWEVTSPVSTYGTNTYAGADGSEINASLFTSVGDYTVTFKVANRGLKLIGDSTYTMPVSIMSQIPVITAEDIEVEVGATVDLMNNVTADDVEDGNITDQITVDPATIDTSYAHEETVTYSVEDSDGTTGTKAIQVSIVETVTVDKEEEGKKGGTITKEGNGSTTTTSGKTGTLSKTPSGLPQTGFGSMIIIGAVIALLGTGLVVYRIRN